MYKYIFFLLITSSSLLSQSNRGNVWILGTNTSPTPKTGTSLIFNHDSLRIVSIEKEMDMYVCNSSICDEQGNLMFYTNGCNVANYNHDTIPGGESVIPGQWTDIGYCDQSGYARQQSALALPLPCNDDLYHLFILDFFVDIAINSPWSVATGLLHNVIDMSANDDNGQVIINNEYVFQDTLKMGAMTAARHANGRDWWILVQEFNSDCFYSVLLNEHGPQQPVKSCTGFQWEDTNSGGVAKFSPDGFYYILSLENEDMSIFSFDNQTGHLNYMEQVEFNEANSRDGVGLSISSNSQFIYISAGTELYQYDLYSDDISQSKTIVAIWDGFMNPQKTTFSRSFLGPDEKIYISSSGSTLNLHVIEDPNQKGEACNVTQHSIDLFSLNVASLPNHPYFGPEPDDGPCDSLLLVDSTFELDWEEPSIKIYPNPVESIIKVELDNSRFVKSIEIRELTGQVVLYTQVHEHTSQLQLDMSRYPSGLYFVSIHTDKGAVVKKVVVE